MSTSAPEHRSEQRLHVWIEIALNRLTDLLSTQSAGSYRVCALLLLITFAAMETILITVGAAPIAGPWDVMALLDGAWRIVCGQVPHTDFHNPIGALTYLLVAFGMRVATPSTSSISYGVALLLLLLLPWAWLLASRRLPATIALAFVLFLAILLATPRPLSYPVEETSYAMFYNREGYVLLSMLLLCLFVRPRTPGRFAASLSGLSMGLLLGLMLYCKITYFIFGAASVVFCWAIDRRQQATLPAVLAGLVLIWLLFAALFHIELRAYLADIAVAGRSQSMGMRLHLISGDLLANSLESYVILLCLVLWVWPGMQVAKVRSAGVRPFLIVIWIFAVALGIDSGNAAQIGNPADPLYVAAGIIAVELYRRHYPEQIRAPQSPQRLAYAVSLLLILPVVAVPILARDLASCSYALLWNLKNRSSFDPSRSLHSAALADFRVPASTTHITGYWPARDHPANINDGIDLLRGHLIPGDRVTTLAYANPFSFALGLQPARDGPQWWDLNFSFDQKHYPSAESFLGSASLVMVLRPTDRTKGWSFETVDLMLELYSDYLQAHFERVDMSEHWILYRRRTGA